MFLFPSRVNDRPQSGSTGRHRYEATSNPAFVLSHIAAHIRHQGVKDHHCHAFLDRRESRTIRCAVVAGPWCVVSRRVSEGIYLTFFSFRPLSEVVDCWFDVIWGHKRFGKSTAETLLLLEYIHPLFCLLHIRYTSLVMIASMCLSSVIALLALGASSNGKSRAIQWHGS